MFVSMLQVAELLGKRAFIESVIVVRIVLVLLWTRVGSLLLCGRQCLGKEWPIINDFGSMGLEKREKVMQNWLKHGFLFTPIRAAFIYLKVFCLFVYFSRVIIQCYLFPLIFFLLSSFP